MVLVQNFLGVGQVQIVLALLIPGEVEHEVEVVVLHAVVRRGRIVFAELGKLLFECLGYGFRPFFLFGALLELVIVFAVVHSELFLDGPKLVVEVVFPLLLVYLALRLLVDVRLYLAKLDLHVEHGEQLHGAHLEVVVLEKLNLVLEVVHLHCRGDEVHQETEIVYMANGPHGFARSHGTAADDLHGLLLERIGNGFDGGAVFVGEIIVQIVDTALQIGFVTHYGVQRQALEALKYGGDAAVRHLQALEYLGHGAVLVKVLFLRVFHGDVGLGDAGDEQPALLGFLDKPDGLVPAYGDWENRPREEDGVPQGEHRHKVRQFRVVHFHETLSLHYRDDVHFRASGHCVYFVFSHKCLSVKMSVTGRNHPGSEYSQSPCQ